MPTYAYLCSACDRQFEIQMSIHEKEETKPRCPLCGSEKVEQQLLGFSLRGAGRTPVSGG